jgi:hypothetical protein
MAAAAAGHFLNRKAINVGIVSIGIDYAQVLAMLANSRIAWPSAIKELFHILSAFNLNIEVVAPECLVPDVTFTNKWYFIMGLPVGVFACFTLAHAATVLYRLVCMRKSRRDSLRDLGSTATASALVLTYVLYIYLTRTILDVFTCMPTSPPDGHLYMAATLEPCGVPGGTQARLLPVAALALALYTVGYPAFLAQLFWRKRELIMEDQLLRAKGMGDDRLTNPHAWSLRQAYGKAYYQFRPAHFYWTLAIVARKLALCLTAVIFNRNASFQLAAALMIMFLAYAAQVRWAPYMPPSGYDAALRDHAILALSSPLHQRLRAALADIAARGRKKATRNKISMRGRLTPRALFGAVAAWLADHNVVEAVLLFSAVVVTLMGIMLGAVGTNSYYASGRDTITVVIIVVVTLTVAYFVGVLITGVCAQWKARTEESVEKARRFSVVRSPGATPTKRPRRSVADLRAALESVTLAAAEQGSGGAGGGPDGGSSSFVNPIFLQAAAAAAAEAGVDPVALHLRDTIATQITPPDAGLWGRFRDQYGSLLEQVASLNKQLLAAKREAARQAELLELTGLKEAAAGAPGSPGGAPGEADDDVSPPRGGSRQRVPGMGRVRNQYAPQRAPGWHVAAPAAEKGGAGADASGSGGNLAGDRSSAKLLQGYASARGLGGGGVGAVVGSGGAAAGAPVGEGRLRKAAKRLSGIFAPVVGRPPSTAFANLGGSGGDEPPAAGGSYDAGEGAEIGLAVASDPGGIPEQAVRALNPLHVARGTVVPGSLLALRAEIARELAEAEAAEAAEAAQQAQPAAATSGADAEPVESDSW